MSEKELRQPRASDSFYSKQQPLQLIKFPSITKLQYLGEDLQAASSTKTKLFLKTSSNRFNSSPPQLNHINTNHQFRVVQVPEQNHLMNICTMNIQQPKTASPFSPSGESEEERSEKKMYLRKGKSQSFLNSLRDGNSLGKNMTNLSKFLTLASQSHKNPLKFKVQRSHRLIESKVNMNELYTQIITALALVNGGVSLNGDVKSFQRMRRARIDKGNNGFIVKQTAKKRNWWSVNQQPQSYSGFHLVWTEHRLKGERMPVPKEQFYHLIEKDEECKIIFQRNIDQALSFYPKMLQLFFTQSQIESITGTQGSTIPKQRSLTNFQSNGKGPVTLKLNKSYEIYKFLTSQEPKIRLNYEFTTLFNHIPNNVQITSKKMLHKNLTSHFQSQMKSPYQFLPITYHLTAYDWQQKINLIQEQCQRRNHKQGWFVKPGQNSNRGRGISVFKGYREALNHIVRNPPKSANKSYIVQEYIQPLLYESRKFDIRCFLLCIQVLNYQVFYWYEEGYIRTSSQKFTMNSTSRQIHLTNDSVQKSFQNYDKYESANKLSYSELDKYLREENNIEFSRDIVPKMKNIATDMCKAATLLGIERPNIEQQKSEVSYSEKGIFFELFGLDFLLSSNGTPYLLEVNTNPCLQINSNLLSRVIPEVLENTFRLVMDVYMPSTKNDSVMVPDWAQSFILNNKYSLLYRRNLQNIENCSTSNKRMQEEPAIKEQESCADLE